MHGLSRAGSRGHGRSAEARDSDEMDAADLEQIDFDRMGD
jgi:hypothetical protein